MADNVGNKAAHDYHLDVPAVQEGFYVKGASNCDWGMKNRMARTFSHRQTKRGRRPFPQTQAFIGSNDLVFINPVRSQIVGIQIVLIRRSVHAMQMRDRLAFGPRSSSFIRIYFSR